MIFLYILVSTIKGITVDLYKTKFVFVLLSSIHRHHIDLISNSSSIVNSKYVYKVMLYLKNVPMRNQYISEDFKLDFFYNGSLK